MIITNVCLLLEALSIVICLHHLYGEKFRLDIATICLLAVDMIMMQIIDYFGWSSVWSVLIYPIIIVYCLIKFGFTLKKLIINFSLSVFIVGGAQVFTMLVFYYALNIHEFNGTHLLFVNFITFFITMVILVLINSEKISIPIKRKEKLLLFSIVVCCLIIGILIINYKEFRILELNQALLIFVCVVFIFVLCSKLVKYKVQIKEAEMELMMNKLYSESFYRLIENIRIRQHEFDNHINAIYSQHYTYDDYEGLVNAQKNYCKLITAENRFNKLLTCGNPIVIGFLYGKFVDLDKQGIDIEYKVNIQELSIGIPVYKIIEILGNLIDNAADALLQNSTYNRLYVNIEEIDNFILEVRNESAYVDYYEIDNFFSKGYSKKGENRGLGLYNIKQICNEYRLNIYCENIEIDETNWLTFRIMKEINK